MQRFTCTYVKSPLPFWKKIGKFLLELFTIPYLFYHPPHTTSDHHHSATFQAQSKLQIIYIYKYISQRTPLCSTCQCENCLFLHCFLFLIQLPIHESTVHGSLVCSTVFSEGFAKRILKTEIHSNFERSFVYLIVDSLKKVQKVHKIYVCRSHVSCFSARLISFMYVCFSVIML